MSQTAFDKPHNLEAVHSRSGGSGDFQADLRDHQICMVIPVGSTIDAFSLELTGGILILGALRGKVHCATGSAIIGFGGEFQGQLEANDVLVEGKITSLMDPSGKPVTPGMSEVRARGQINSAGQVVGGILALSERSFVCAKLSAVAFRIPQAANLSRSTIEMITPA